MSVVAALGLAAAIAGQPSADPLASLQERLNVREVEVVLEPPVGKGLRDLRIGDLQPSPDPGMYVRVGVPALKGQGDLRPADLLVLEDGKVRPVLRLEPLAAAAAHPWTFRIYFDLVLALPDTVFSAAIALARQADQLVQLGTVEIVVADPEPHTTLATSRDAPAIKEALASLAAQSRRDPRAKPFSRLTPSSPATIRRQCDRLVTSLTDSATLGAHALLLVAEPQQLSAGALHLLTAVATAGSESTGTNGDIDRDGVASRGAPSEDPALVLGETARLLAAYGWVTVALPIHRLPGSREPLPEDDYARFRRQHWEDPHTPGAIPVVGLIVALVQMLRGKQAHAPDMRLLAPQLGMENASLMALVRPTAGLVVPYREALGPALDALAARWHLWYQADALPAGRDRPVTVSLLANALDLRTPRWVHSSIPEELTTARLRRNLNGDSLPGPLRVSAAMLAPPAAAAAPRGARRVAMRLAAGPSPLTSIPLRSADTGGADPPGPLVLLAQAASSTEGRNASSGPLRVSFAWTDAREGVSVTHQLLDAAAVDLWNQRHALLLADPRPSPGRHVLAVLIEDLASEVWGCAVVASAAEADGLPPTDEKAPRSNPST